jgi:integrase
MAYHGLQSQGCRRRDASDQGHDRTIDNLYLPIIQNKRASYKGQKQHLSWWSTCFRAQPVLTIQPIDIERATSALIAVGLAKATVNRYCATLRHVMRKLVSPLAWVLEFWKRVELFNEEQERKIRHPMTDAQEDLLYTSLDLQDALYVRLDVLLGLRLSHFFSLRWEYLWWSHAVLHLPPVKRRTARLLPVPQEGMAILAILWEQQGRPTDGWMFPVRKLMAVGTGYKQ